MHEPGLQVGARKSVGAGLVKLKEAKWKTYRLENGRFKLLCEGALYE
ncbi:MAG: hypothetical protein QXI56_08200 [Candidatus Bathyarchaeia archaeon]